MVGDIAAFDLVNNSNSLFLGYEDKKSKDNSSTDNCIIKTCDVSLLLRQATFS